MNRRRIILLLSVVLVVLGLWWLLRAPQTGPDAGSQTVAEHPTPTAEQVQAPRTSSSEEEDKKRVLDQVAQVFSAPIAFYGRVIDQNGDPVPHASVGYTAADKFNASGSNYTGQADENGSFEISGIQGAGLAVTVRKEGYYLIHNPSDRSLPTSTAAFAYGMGPDSYRRPAPTKDNPAVFVLHKMGETEPLMRVEKGERIPKDGTPATVDLMTGRLSPSGNLRVEAWTEAPVEGRRFTWRCRVTVPGGGLVERRGQFDFEAPEDGYEESVELGMPGEAEQWASQQQRDYFVKLPDGRYARINFTMIAGGNHYFLLESFLNPTPGSRNLEYDPKQTAGAP
jgi:hypothetical protein